MQSHVLRIPNLPSLAGLLISNGDTIVEGERIARYVDDDALALSQQTYEQAAARLPELEAELTREQERHEAIIEARQTALAIQAKTTLPEPATSSRQAQPPETTSPDNNKPPKTPNTPYCWHKPTGQAPAINCKTRFVIRALLSPTLNVNNARP